MNPKDLLRALADTRAQTEAALAGLTEDQLIDPGVIGDWSVKDILAHLTAWEAELVTLLVKVKRGQKPTWPTPTEFDDLNAKWHKETKNRPLDRVLADWRGVRKQTVRQVEGLTEADLNQKWGWLRNRVAHDLIASNSCRHEAEHLAQIQAWQQQSSEAPRKGS